MAWLYVPGMAVLNSESRSPSPDTDAFVMWRGKPMPPRLLCAAWAKKPWMKLLFGLTCEPSEADRGVASWISSLAATRASRSASPGSEGASETPGISGPESVGSSRRSGPSGASSRTWRDTYRLDSRRSRETFDAWATRLRRACSRRRKSARAISESGCSSWPTPTASQQNLCGANPERRVNPRGEERMPLSDVAMRWAERWPTPSARDWRDGRCGEETAARNSRPLNEFAVTMWPTPRSASAMCRESLRPVESIEKHVADRGRVTSGNLEDVAALWSTPRASDGEKGGPNMSFGAGGTPLPTQAMAFPSSRPDPETSTSGEPSSTPARSLNPLFVEWLQGWPIGWTGSEVSATEFAHWKRRMRGALSALQSRDETPKVGEQLSLFA